MPGVRTSSKDRWRQAGGARLLTSRLASTLAPPEPDSTPHTNPLPVRGGEREERCTLEVGISTKQTDEMRRQQLTLVVPTGLHATYTAAQLAGMLSVTEFVEFVRQKQAK